MPDLPIAIATVYFDGDGVTGEQLAALVQQVANRMDPHTVFIAEPRFYNGTVRYIGQAGGNYRHTRVVPTLDGPSYIRPNDRYFKVEVTSHSWDEPGRYSETQMVDYIVREVIEFAAELRKAHQAALTDGFPDYVDPDPIPWETDGV